MRVISKITYILALLFSIFWILAFVVGALFTFGLSSAADDFRTALTLIGITQIVTLVGAITALKNISKGYWLTVAGLFGGLVVSLYKPMGSYPQTALIILLVLSLFSAFQLQKQKTK